MRRNISISTATPASLPQRRLVCRNIFFFTATAMVFSPAQRRSPQPGAVKTEGEGNEQLGPVGRGRVGQLGAARGVPPRAGRDACPAGSPAPRGACSPCGRAREGVAELGSVPVGFVGRDRACEAGRGGGRREESGEGTTAAAGPADGRTAAAPGGPGPRRALWADRRGRGSQPPFCRPSAPSRRLADGLGPPAPVARRGRDPAGSKGHGLPRGAVHSPRMRTEVLLNSTWTHPS